MQYKAIDEKFSYVGTNQKHGTHNQSSPSLYAGLQGKANYHRQGPLLHVHVGSDGASRDGQYCEPSHIDHPRLQLLPPYTIVAEADQDQWVSLPNGSLVWRVSLSWLFCPSYLTISKDQSNNKLRLTADLDSEGKTSIEDFNKILGSMAYAEPRMIEDAVKMLEAVSKMAVKLAGNHPCIILIAYTQAATLMSKMDWAIVEIMERIDWFLVRLLHKIDREVQLAFHTIYKQVIQAQSSAFRINKSIIATIYDQIDTIFNQIMRNQVSDFHLPIELENNSTREILKDGDKLPVNPKNKQKREGTTPTYNYRQKIGS